MELSGQVAIVTGAGRGIGRATALELARLGADIVVAELDKPGAERTAGEVTALGRRALALATDVTRRADLTAMVERTRAAFGRVDILVNNAGIYRAASTLQITEDHWDAVLTINAKAVFFASQAVLPTMIAQKRGAIVNLASMAGKIGSANNLPYNASKAAVISITKSLALAHAADGIRVNCVCPGFVDGPEPDQKRHMLRLWLKFPKPWPLSEEFPTHMGYKPSQDPRELVEAETE